MALQKVCSILFIKMMMLTDFMLMLLLFCCQIFGAAPGVSAVGQAADVLPQCTAPQHRGAGSSQSQASRRHQLPPAGQHHSCRQQCGEEQQRSS